MLISLLSSELNQSRFAFGNSFSLVVASHSKADDLIFAVLVGLVENEGDAPHRLLPILADSNALPISTQILAVYHENHSISSEGAGHAIRYFLARNDADGCFSIYNHTILSYQFICEGQETNISKPQFSEGEETHESKLRTVLRLEQALRSAREIFG